MENRTQEGSAEDKPEWQETSQFAEFLLAAFVNDTRVVPLRTLVCIKALAIELRHVEGRDIKMLPGHPTFGSQNPGQGLSANRRDVSHLLFAMAQRFTVQSSPPRASAVCRALLKVARLCVSTHALITLTSCLSYLARGIWGAFSKTDHDDKVAYSPCGIEKYMSIFSTLVPPRAVVRKKVQENDKIAGIWFSKCRVEAAPMFMASGLTLPPKECDYPFLSTAILPSPRRAAHAVATAALLEVFEGELGQGLTTQSSVGDIVEAATKIRKRVLGLCRLVQPRARATRGLDHLDPQSLNFVYVRENYMKKISPMAIPLLTFGAWVVKAFAQAEENEEILLGVVADPQHSAIAMRHYCKLSVTAPLPQRVAAMYASALILGDVLRLPSVMFDILVPFDDGRCFAPMDMADPDLVLKWSPPEKDGERADLPRVPSPVDTYGFDRHLLEKPRKQYRRRRQTSNWSRVVDRAISDLD